MSDLISRSELTAAIKRQYCTGCNNYDGVRCSACHADDMLALVDDMADAGPRWISVEERLPEDCKHVLVFMRRNFVVGWSVDYWHIDTDWLDDGNWSKNPAGGYYNITHWMPLPEPPKEDQV